MALLMDDDDEHKHFNYDKIVDEQNLSKKKRKKLLKKDNTGLEEDDFQVVVKDPRFQAMFTSHLYNLDPYDPGYKKTKATQSIQVEKQRQRDQELTGPTHTGSGSKETGNNCQWPGGG
ncbi:ESF1 homolog [Salvelinus alpinus]|uniref:ESF1 homolog n=1 Tax=Salvelinus alpinus TaxID=8036 RepID=UPI0039FCEE98